MNKFVSLMTYGILALSSSAMAAGQAQNPTDHTAMGHAKPAAETKAQKEFRALDKNKDGKLSKAELPSDHPMAGHFDMMDTDKDGALSEAEYTVH